MKLGIFGAQQRGKLADSDPRLQTEAVGTVRFGKLPQMSASGSASTI
jgi:hypothetical protein